MLGAQNAVFYNMERGSAEGPDLEFTMDRIRTYVEPGELGELLARSTKVATMGRIAFIRSVPYPNKR